MKPKRLKMKKTLSFSIPSVTETLAYPEERASPPSQVRPNIPSMREGHKKETNEKEKEKEKEEEEEETDEVIKERTTPLDSLILPDAYTGEPSAPHSLSPLFKGGQTKDFSIFLQKRNSSLRSTTTPPHSAAARTPSLPSEDPSFTSSPIPSSFFRSLEFNASTTHNNNNNSNNSNNHHPNTISPFNSMSHSSGRRNSSTVTINLPPLPTPPAALCVEPLPPPRLGIYNTNNTTTNNNNININNKNNSSGGGILRSRSSTCHKMDDASLPKILRRHSADNSADPHNTTGMPNNNNNNNNNNTNNNTNAYTNHFSEVEGTSSTTTTTSTNSSTTVMGASRPFIPSTEDYILFVNATKDTVPRRMGKLQSYASSCPPSPATYYSSPHILPPHDTP